MTNKEYESYRSNNRAFRIKYVSPSGSGEIEIDTKLYEKRLKQFRSKFKDCTILSFEEVEKPEEHTVRVGYRDYSGRYIRNE